MIPGLRRSVLALALAGLATSAAPAQSRPPEPVLDPDAVIDLRTAAGVALVQGHWRYHDVKIVDARFRAAGADNKASGPFGSTNDIEPHASAPGFDDHAWQTVAPERLEGRRGGGKFSAVWYRFRFVVPRRVGAIDPTGYDIVFEATIDDYSEVSVDGRLPLLLGQAGGGAIAGWNTPNRVVVARDVRAGQAITLAVFGVNGPVSNPPPNYIWIRSATLDLYKPDRLDRVLRDAGGSIVRSDPALDAIVPLGEKIEQVATGFQFTEGPLWVRDGNYLLFSDPNANTIYRWTQDGRVAVFRTKSGYTGTDIGEYSQPGSNGLTLDSRGRLTIDEMGNRRVTRLEKNGTLTVLADRFQGKRFNSPNDLVYRSDGALYFTDPPFGLPKQFDDRRKELPFSGVFCVCAGVVKLETKDFDGPNGLAFSPDEKYLYVGNWADRAKVVERYPVAANGDLGRGELFFDLTSIPGADAIDGMKVDVRGNLYVSGPGGIEIFSPQAKLLGTIVPPEHPHNLAWGDADGKTLYLASQTSIYRIRLNVAGIRP